MSSAPSASKSQTAPARSSVAPPVAKYFAVKTTAKAGRFSPTNSRRSRRKGMRDCWRQARKIRHSQNLFYIPLSDLLPILIFTRGGRKKFGRDRSSTYSLSFESNQQ